MRSSLHLIMLSLDLSSRSKLETVILAKELEDTETRRWSSIMVQILMLVLKIVNFGLMCLCTDLLSLRGL